MGMLFMIIWDMFHRRISLSSVLLLQLLNFVSGFRLELMYISLIVNAIIKSSLTHLCGFKLLVLLPSSESKVKFRQASNLCKRVLKSARNVPQDFWQIISSSLPDVVVITTAQLYSTKLELRFFAGSNPARGMSEIHNGGDLWQWSRLEIRLNTFRRSIIP